VTALLGVLLTAASLMVGMAGAAAAAPAGPTQDCTPWELVPESEDPYEGYLNDLHGRVWPELQQCSVVPGGPMVQWYGRAVYHHLGPDTEPYESAGVKVRLYDFTSGCHGCETIWATPRIPEPGVGLAIFGQRILLDPAVTYGVDASVTYVNPPNPLWIQTGTKTFDVPD
jgi:hypothetical protein